MYSKKDILNHIWIILGLTAIKYYLFNQLFCSKYINIFSKVEIKIENLILNVLISAK